MTDRQRRSHKLLGGSKNNTVNTWPAVSWCEMIRINLQQGYMVT